MKTYNDKYRTVRIKTEDYNELLKVSEKSKVSIVNLIGIGVQALKRKYRIKEVDNGN